MPNIRNPYLPQDVMTIIDAYAGVGGGKPYKSAGPLLGLPDLGNTEGALVGEGIDILRNLSTMVKEAGGDASWAIASERLESHLDDAKGSVEALYSYGTHNFRIDPVTGEPVDTRSDPFDVGPFQGLTMQNTWYTMSNADNAAEAMATMAADCVPCEDRILALLSLNPLDDLWTLLDIGYEEHVRFILDLFDILLGDKSMYVFADICSLFKFLDFMCLPDLYRMVMMLSLLSMSYATKMGDFKASFVKLLGEILGPSLTPFIAILDKYIQLIVAPVECILTSLDAQLQKLEVGKAFRTAVLSQEGAEREMEIDSDEISEEIFGVLYGLRGYLKKSSDEVEDQYKKMKDTITSYLGLQDEADQSLLSLIYHMENLLKMIGLIQAIIQAIQQGAVICGNQEEVETLFANYIQPRFDLDIQVQNNAVRISPSPPEEIGALLEVLGTLKKEASLKDPPATAETKAAELPEIVVPLSNCLYTVSDNELERVRDFLGSYEEGGT